MAEYLLPSVLVEALLKRSRVLVRLALSTCVGVWFPESIPPWVSLSWTALSPVLLEVETQPLRMTLDPSYSSRSPASQAARHLILAKRPTSKPKPL